VKSVRPLGYLKRYKYYAKAPQEPQHYAISKSPVLLFVKFSVINFSQVHFSCSRAVSVVENYGRADSNRCFLQWGTRLERNLLHWFRFECVGWHFFKNQITCKRAQKSILVIFVAVKNGCSLLGVVTLMSR